VKEVIEMYPRAGTIHVRIANHHVAYGYSTLAQWAQLNFEGLNEPVVPECPSIWNLMRERTVLAEQLTNEEWRHPQDAALQYAEENIAAFEEIRMRKGVYMEPLPSPE
jgi:hypothetical protein